MAGHIVYAEVIRQINVLQQLVHGKNTLLIWNQKQAQLLSSTCVRNEYEYCPTLLDRQTVVFDVNWCWMDAFSIFNRQHQTIQIVYYVFFAISNFPQRQTNQHFQLQLVLSFTFICLIYLVSLLSIISFEVTNKAIRIL